MPRDKPCFIISNVADSYNKSCVIYMETRPPIIARIQFCEDSAYAHKKKKCENLLNICTETVIDNHAVDNKKLSLLILLCDNSYSSRTCFTRSVYAKKYIREAVRCCAFYFKLYNLICFFLKHSQQR